MNKTSSTIEYLQKIAANFVDRGSIGINDGTGGEVYVATNDESFSALCERLKYAGTMKPVIN